MLNLKTVQQITGRFHGNEMFYSHSRYQECYIILALCICHIII
jgi:hypothetical protein